MPRLKLPQKFEPKIQDDLKSLPPDQPEAFCCFSNPETATRTALFLGIPRLAFCHRQRQKNHSSFADKGGGSGGSGTQDKRSRKSQMTAIAIK